MARIPVLFRPELVAPDQGASPSAHKPAQVVADWQAHGLPIEVIAPPPVTRRQLALAHEAAYVDGVLDCEEPNGFGNRSRAVAATLPYTSGAMLAAARAALANGKVAVAPVSGFHHAGFDFGGGYCTFNGLMVAACVLHDEGRVERVGIIDFDQHFGNGTDDIIRRRHIRWIEHCTAGMKWHRPAQAAEFLDEIPQIVARMKDCNLILYQAGADPHVNDPLGGWLTTEQLRSRDRRVFAAAAEWKVPVAWNLAGGYQRTEDGGIGPVLEIHRNTMRECVMATFTSEPGLHIAEQQGFR
jgi:acetoin utilization deacetylase AcuC-like enzyme